MPHTPGPWQFVELPNPKGADGLGYIRPNPEDGHEIAHHGDMDRSRGENLANGHLIKAAPMMLAALEELAGAVSMICDGLSTDATYYERLERAEFKARAAIKAAWGK